MYNLTGFKTIVYKEVSRVFRIRKQTLLPSVITSSLYFIVFGHFLGSKISSINGIPYINFIVPGLVLMSVITSSYTNTSSSFYSGKFQKSIEEVLVSPLPKSYILLGYVLGGMIRGFMVGILVLIVAMFCTNLEIYNFIYSFLFLFFSAALFSLAGFLNGLFAKSFDDVNFIPTFIITPLTYLGGVFYSTSLLSGYWKILNELNPILYMINGFRYGFLGIADVNVNVAVLIVVLVTVILYFLNLYLLKKGFNLKS